MERTTSEKPVVVASEYGHSATETCSHDRSIQAPEATPKLYTRESAIAAALAVEREIEAEWKSRAGEGSEEDIDDDDDDDSDDSEWKSRDSEWITSVDNSYTTIEADKDEIARLYREDRKYIVQNGLIPQYLYDTKDEPRYCVWIDDGCYWPAKSSGIMWVGVHGADSVCVVTMRGHLDTKRVLGDLKDFSEEFVLSLFRKSIICELEDLEDPASEERKKLKKCIKKPFGVVSANPGTNNIEASDYDEDKAIDFLMVKMKRDIVFDAYETTKTAIQAFQHLFRKKVKADEIEVSVMDPDCIYVNTGQDRGSNVEELSVGQIEMYLDDTIGESGLMEMGNLKRAIGPDHKFLKKQRTNRGTYLLSPGGSSDI